MNSHLQYWVSTVTNPILEKLHFTQKQHKWKIKKKSPNNYNICMSVEWINGMSNIKKIRTVSGVNLYRSRFMYRTHSWDPFCVAVAEFSCFVRVSHRHEFEPQLFHLPPSSLMTHLGKHQKMPQVLGHLYPCGRSEWSSYSVASSWPNACHCSHLESNQPHEDHLFSLTLFYATLPFKINT